MYNGYGAATQNAPSSYSMRDANGNLTMVNGQVTSSSYASASGAQYGGGGVGTQGAGQTYGQATAIGNSLNVTVLGSHNTTIIDQFPTPPPPLLNNLEPGMLVTGGDVNTNTYIQSVSGPTQVTVTRATGFYNPLPLLPLITFSAGTVFNFAGANAWAGSVTVNSTRAGRAPRLSAASSSRRSRLRSEM